MDIEAVTGFLVRGFMRLQLNIPIKKDLVKVQRINKGKINISYLTETNEKMHLKSIPVFWGEYGGEAGGNDIDNLKHKVTVTYDKFGNKNFFTGNGNKNFIFS